MPKGTRVPPQDLDVERALLGALLMSQSAIYEVSDAVGIDSFYAGKHRAIFDAMLALHGKGEPLDVVTVSAKLKERKQISEIGGASYLSELVNAAASPGSARHYAQTVQTKYLLRCLIDASSTIGELGFQEDRDIEKVLDEAQQAIFAVSQTPMLRTFNHIKDTLSSTLERLEQLRQHAGTVRGVPTGFRPLDNMLSGFQNSDLIILAARPSMGKTALALDIARRTAVKHGTSVGVFSLEMSTDQLVDRMLAAQAGVDAWKLRVGKINSTDQSHLHQAISVLEEAPIFIDDKPGTSILSMRSVARRLKMEKGMQLLIVDYLQLIIPSSSGKGNESMVQQVTEISRSLKSLARELNVPVIALSQLSRAVESRGGRPRLSDLRDSGSIEQDADVVMFIHREDMTGNRTDEKERTNVAEILIEKHRNGPVGKVDLIYEADKVRFNEIEKGEFADFENTEANLQDAPF